MPLFDLILPTIFATMEQKKGGGAMTAYQQFLELKQEPRRLAIALTEYFTDEAHRDAYGAYLQRRIRPAAAALMDADDIERLEGLRQWFTAPLVDELLRTAIRLRKPAAAVWLLQVKQAQFGFPGHGLSL